MASPHVQPTDFTIRAFHYRTLIKEGAHFAALGNTAVAVDYGRNTGEENANARALGLADLSPLPRTGFKGKEAIAWLRTQDLEIGDTNNRAYSQPDSSLIARLGDTDALVLGNVFGTDDRCKRLENTWQSTQPARCFQVPRRDASAWFLITGQRASQMFAKICGVDLRLAKFPNGSIAQSSIARMNAIAIRADIDETPAFHLLFDSASADYMWTCLKDAIAEFNGVPVGHAAVLALYG